MSVSSTLGAAGLPSILMVVSTIAFLVLERVRPGRELPHSPGWYLRAVLMNLAQLAVTLATAKLWTSLFGAHALLHLSHGLPPVAQGMAAWFVGTFVFYWWHRLRHEKGWWLAFHQIHHSPSRIEILTSFYKHPLEIFCDAALSAVVLYPLLGCSLAGGIWYTFFAGTGEYFYHANVRTPRWLRYLIQTPELHSIHHQLDVHRFNYSDIPLWDRLFGTYQDTTSFVARCGFPQGAESRLPEMLAFKDVYAAPALREVGAETCSGCGGRTRRGAGRVAMRRWRVAVVAALGASLSGCVELWCAPSCHARHQESSSLVTFLYPDGKAPPRDNSVPQLRLPLRVGLTFLPSPGGGGPTAAQKQQLLERVRDHFRSESFVSDIVVIPDYYLATQRGFEGLAAVQRLYSLDLMALVSYDQVTNTDNNNWSLGYLTIVGAYVLRGDRYDLSTLLDLAVVDPATRSLVLRAGGIDTRHGTATLIEAPQTERAASTAGYDAAAGEMIAHFDTALTELEAQVKAGKANVQVVHGGEAGGAGGAGAFEWSSLAALLLLAFRRVLSPSATKV